MTSTEILTILIGVAAAAIIHALHRVADAINNLFIIEDEDEEPEG